MLACQIGSIDHIVDIGSSSQMMSTHCNSRSPIKRVIDPILIQ